MPVPITAAASIISSLSTLVDNLPHLEEEAVIEVRGKPGSKLNDLYFLGLATAFGLIKRFDALQWLTPPPGLLMVECDHSDNWVRVTLKQRVSLVTSTYAGGIEPGGGWSSLVNAALTPGVIPGPIGGLLPQLPQAVPALGSRQVPAYDRPLYAGLSESVVGGAWNITSEALPGIPNNETSLNVKSLPFTGRTILTRNPLVQDPNPAIANPNAAPIVPSMNPHPAGDNRSRGNVPRQSSFVPNETGTFLAQLVYAALSDPGSYQNTTFAPPTGGPTGG